MPPDPIAHSPNEAGHPHPLATHLTEVARLAALFADRFGSGAYAEAAGLWHDLGKNNPKFQARLGADPDAGAEDARGPSRERVGHSAAGAIHALNELGPGLGRPLAFVIAGHHAGLADAADLFDGRLRQPAAFDELTAALSHPNKVVPAVARPTPPAFLRQRSEESAADVKRRYELWVRMLFSCLVDADFLDTERHFDAGKAGDRVDGHVLTPDHLAAFDAHMATRFKDATGPVNEVRRRVLDACRGHGRVERERGQRVFTLTAPTGCGKTLAGMGFALEHARTHGLRRVIVVIPYTSIIDQNAAEYRAVFGPDAVLEHHSSIDVDDPARETQWARLARENWDAPVVVTTSVQFLESLLANRTARCRKLHNVADSVVIFDEVQTLPVGHLLPIVDVLTGLVADYGVSLVLSTATQPALGHRASASQVFPGFRNAVELVPDLAGTFEALRRVDVAFDREETTWDALAADTLAEPEVLVITHLRKDARELAEKVDGSVHLSALMCPKHRRKVLADIRARLAVNAERRRAGLPVEPLRVVTTQLVEAGVDIDFPVVFRAFAGFDSVAQAAGRCNRNGLLRDAAGNPARGRVQVFRAPTKPPPGTLRDAQAVAAGMLAARPGLDPLDPAIYEPYFQRLYFARGLGGNDEAGVQALREACRFKSVAEAFRMIDDDWSAAVVVPYDAEAVDLLNQLRRLNGVTPKADAAKGIKGEMRGVYRKLQPYTVTAPRRLVESPAARGAFIPELAGVVNAIDPAFRDRLYSERYGLEFKDELSLVYDPDYLAQ